MSIQPEPRHFQAVFRSILVGPLTRLYSTLSAVSELDRLRVESAVQIQTRSQFAAR
jgi:hypothetical protein